MRSGGWSVNIGSVRGWSPATMRVRRSMTICAASVARIITNMVLCRFHSGRTTMRSSRMPSPATSPMARIAASGSGRPNRVERDVGDHAAEHHERPLGEIDDAAGVVDDAEADADEAVDATHRDTAGDRLGDELKHARPPWCRGRRRSRRGSSAPRSAFPRRSGGRSRAPRCASATFITRLMSCSISSTAVPPSAICRNKAASRVVSSRLRPAAGSSSRSSRGSAASARVISSEPLLAVRQHRGERVGLRREPDPDPAGAARVVLHGGLDVRRAVRRQRRQQAAPGMQVAADLHVLQHGEVVEQLGELEGPHQAAPGDRLWRQSGDVVSPRRATWPALGVRRSRR